MNRLGTRISVSILAIMFLTTIITPAEEKESVWDMLEFTIIIGSTTEGDLVFTDNSELILDSSIVTGAKLSYYLSRTVAIEISGLYRFDSAIYVFDKDYGSGSLDAFRKEKFENWHFTGGALINFGDLVNVPYITFGIGLSTLNFSEEFDIPSAKNRFTLFGGLGYKYFFSSNLAARAEFTFLWYGFDKPDGGEDLYMNIILNAGITFRIH